MKRGMIKSGLLVVVALLVAMPVIGCVPAEEGPAPPPEAKVIKIGMLADMTGPYSTIGVPIFNGYFDYMRYLNEEKGGINGIKIEVLWADHKGDPSFAITVYKRFKGDGMIALMPTTSTETSALLAMLEADKIPATGTAASKHVLSPPGWYYSPRGEMGIMFSSFLKWFSGESDLSKPIKVGMVSWDNVIGRAAADGSKAWITKHPGDYELVADLYVSPMAMDFSSELTVIKGKKPDLVLAGVSGAAYGMVARDAGRVDLPADIPMLFERGIFSAGNIAISGAEIARAFTCGGDMIEADNTEGIRLVHDLAQRYRDITEVSHDYQAGVLCAMTLTEAIRMALEVVGYENLDGAAIKEHGFDKMTNFETGLASPTTYDPGNRVGTRMMRITRYDYEKKMEVMVSDWFLGTNFGDLEY